jgi:hypothetical protein
LAEILKTDCGQGLFKAQTQFTPELIDEGVILRNRRGNVIASGFGWQEWPFECEEDVVEIDRLWAAGKHMTTQGTPQALDQAGSTQNDEELVQVVYGDALTLRNLFALDRTLSKALGKVKECA